MGMCIQIACIHDSHTLLQQVKESKNIYPIVQRTILFLVNIIFHAILVYTFIEDWNNCLSYLSYWPDPRFSLILPTLIWNLNAK